MPSHQYKSSVTVNNTKSMFKNMHKRKRKAKHKIYLKYVLILYLIIIINLTILYALPFIKSVYSFPKISIHIILLSAAMAISLSNTPKKSFRKNIIYVYIILILLLTAPIFFILMNIVIVKYDKDKISLFEPYNYSCSMYHQQKDFDVWWNQSSYWYEKFNITREMFEAFPLKNGFSSEFLHLKKKNVPANEIKMGEVVLYKREDNGSFIISRVVGKEYKGNTSFILLSEDNNRIFYEGVIEEKVYVRLEETFQSKFFRFFARGGCGNATSVV